MASIDDTRNGPATKKQRLTVLDAFISSKNDDFKLVRLTYISRPTRFLSEDEKTDLLIKSKKRNADMNVTGILFFADDLYMQTLEGARVALLDLVQRINRDGRHSQLTITSIEYIESRIYPRWSMERVVLSDDSLFIMNNLFNTIVSSFDVLRTYSQQSVIMDWLANGELKQRSENANEKVKEPPADEVILYCDLSLFGLNISEELEPKQQIAFVNKFIKTCSDLISGYRGQFTKYVGDSVLGVFGLEYIENAVDAALEIQRVISQIREKASNDFADPEQIMFCSMGITIGEFRPQEDQPQIFTTQQEKNFIDFFGTQTIKPPKSLIGGAKTPGYETFEGEALDVAIRLKRATNYYRIPVLMSEKARTLYVNTRKRALGLQPYPEAEHPTPVQTNLKTVPTPGGNPLENADPSLLSTFSSFFSPFAPPTAPRQSVAPPPPVRSPKNPEIELSLVGTVRVKTNSVSGEEESVNVYAPVQFLNDNEPFRNASEKVTDWKKTLDQLRYGSL